MKPIHELDDEESIKCNQQQEGVRKDIERAFGVLKSCFEVLRGSSGGGVEKTS